jgi:PAS domain S-box-containing protein
MIAEAPSGKIIFVNNKTQETAKQYLGRSVLSELGEYRDLQDSGSFEMFAPDGRLYEPDEWPLMRSITSGEEVRDWEYYYTLADGTRPWFRGHSSPIYDDEGRMVAGVMVTRDLTEEKRAGERVRFQAHLLDAVGQAVVAIDMQGKITYWNRGAEELYGWSAQEVMERPAREVLVSEDQQERATEIISELRAGRSWTGEFVVQRRDGTTFPAMVTDTPVRDERGDLVGIIGVSIDIAERKEAEEALRESHRRTENILESITDQFYALDRESRYTYINERALDNIRKAKGEELTREDLMGKNCWERFPETVGTRFDQELHRALREQRTVEFESYSPPAGRWVGVHAYPSEEGLAVYVQDINERNLAEQEIETRTHQQAVVAELGLRALANDDLQDLMDEAVALVARTLEVEYAKIGELLPGGEELLLRAGVGWREGLVGEATETAGLGSQAGYTTLVSNEAVIVEDLREETRFRAPPLLVEHGIVSSMTVVIPASEGPFGVLGVHTTTHRTFSEDDVSFLQGIANVLAMAIERARRLRRSKRKSERQSAAA